MTVYLSIVKELLIKNIKNWQTKSIAKDGSPFNAVGSFFLLGRDQELSQFKQQTASNLITNIQNIQTGSCDADSLKMIEQLLTNAKKEADTEARKKGYNQGTFSAMTAKTYEIAKDFFEKFNTFQLLDVRYSPADPFDIYRFFLASYLAQKVYDTHHPGLVKYYTEHPRISNMALLTQDRERLVQAALTECIKKLDRLDKSNSDYLHARKDSVLESIQALKRENELLCKKYGIELAVPVFSVGIASLNVGMPPLQPDHGCIEICMEAATTAIKNISVVTQVVEPRGNQIGDYFPRVPMNNSPEFDKQTSPSPS